VGAILTEVGKGIFPEYASSAQRGVGVGMRLSPSGIRTCESLLEQTAATDDLVEVRAADVDVLARQSKRANNRIA